MTTTSSHDRVRLALLCAILTGAGAFASARPDADLAAILSRFLAPDARALVSYRAVRELAASTRGGRMHATMEALTTLDALGRFTYEVRAEEGSALIRQRVLLAALAAEERAVRPSELAGSALTPANYDFLSLSTHESVIRLDVKPRRKAVMLFEGSIFLTGDSADLKRIEGQLAERPSFWTRRVKIVREYARIDGVRVPVAMRSTADVWLAGASSFDMTYRYLEINGRPTSGN